VEKGRVTRKVKGIGRNIFISKLYAKCRKKEQIKMNNRINKRTKCN